MLNKFNKLNETQKTIVVTIFVCFVCSVLVSISAIGLKPLQEQNIKLYKQTTILKVAGLLDGNEDAQAIEAKYSNNVQSYIVDLINKKIDFSNTFIEEQTGFVMTQESANSRLLSKGEDLAQIQRIENFTTIYTVNDQNSKNYNINKDTIVVLPIRFYGLWSTIQGYIAIVMSDKNYSLTVKGIDFVSHGETPGLGGEIDNPNWKAIWQGKSIYSRSGNVNLSVVKQVSSSEIENTFQVDGLAGATLTSRGVDNGIKFWLSKNGFYDILKLFYKGAVIFGENNGN